MNTKNKGDISEAVIAAEFLKLNIPVSKPFGDNQPYDLIIDLQGSLKKVQVKTARIRKGAVIFNVCGTQNTHIEKKSKSKNYKGKVDFIAAYCPDNQQSYLLSIDECGINLMTLRITESNSNHKTKPRFAIDYILAHSRIVRTPG